MFGIFLQCAEECSSPVGGSGARANELRASRHAPALGQSQPLFTCREDHVRKTTWLLILPDLSPQTHTMYLAYARTTLHLWFFFHYQE
ncbi:hypothetical protein E2C01_029850 [Portunus trituberculatus]|uniref:Uncharacterized protein n=1 Tax=Portunus trituberculatus TaxID=210409 RepID=A0A5B7EQF2_PORTR|nr:hypothetical protein [Portunus trituberculatus]